MSEEQENVPLDTNAMLNEFDAAWEDQSNIGRLQEQIKVIKASIKERFKAFVSEYNVEDDIINDAWTRYLKLKAHKANPSDENYYAAMAAVDSKFIEDEEEED
jgi:hypothetical protein